MKTRHILFWLAVIGFVASALAQHITNWTHFNAVSEEQARKAAAQLVIGMPQKDAIRQLSTNGLRPSSGERYTNRWVAIYCLTNGGCDLSLEFRQKPGTNGLIMEAKVDSFPMLTEETANPFVAMTNGILHAALFHNFQVARTNAL